MPTDTNKSWIVAALLFTSLIAGCGGGPAADKTDEDQFAQAMAYANCMRENGMPDFADPERNDGGGFKMSKRMKKGQEAAMRKAEEACRDLDPQNEQDDSGTVDTAKLAAWTVCMRAKIPGLPDPEVSGGSITIDLRATGIEGGPSSDYQKARESCGDAGGNTRTLSGDVPGPGVSGDVPAPAATEGFPGPAASSR